jgi:hypothetical protein
MPLSLGILFSAMTYYFQIRVYSADNNVSILSHPPKHNATMESYIPSLESIGHAFGKIAGKILHMPIVAIVRTLDESIGLPTALSNGRIYIASFFAGVITYILSTPFTKIIEYHRGVWQKREMLTIAQDTFLEEFEMAIERTTIALVKSQLLNVLEMLLVMSSRTSSAEDRVRIAHIISTYSNNYDILYLSILSKIECEIRDMSVAEIIKISHIEQSFLNRMFQLMRDGSEEVSQQMFQFNQSLLNAPIDSRDKIANSAQLLADLTISPVTTIIRHTRR